MQGLQTQTHVFGHALVAAPAQHIVELGLNFGRVGVGTQPQVRLGGVEEPVLAHEFRRVGGLDVEERFKANQEIGPQVGGVGQVGENTRHGQVGPVFVPERASNGVFGSKIPAGGGL